MGRYINIDFHYITRQKFFGKKWTWENTPLMTTVRSIGLTLKIKHQTTKCSQKEWHRGDQVLWKVEPDAGVKCK